MTHALRVAPKIGRPHTLAERPDLAERIAESVASGLPLKYAAARHGLHPSTVHRWLAEGERDEDGATPQGQLFVALTAARAVFVERMLAELDERGRDSKRGAWTACAWRLERSFPADFGQRRDVRAEVTPGPGPSFADVDPARWGHPR